MRPNEKPDNLVKAVAKCLSNADSARLRGMDRKLRYAGHDRFVLFYYEPRGQEVVWRDTGSYGFATGAWQVFFYELAPIADRYKVNLGCDRESGTHVLLIDRKTCQAYFVKKSEAFRFLLAMEQAQNPPLTTGGVPGMELPVRCFTLQPRNRPEEQRTGVLC